MDRRSVQAIIFLFWAASMIWLAKTKMVPLWYAASQPDQRVFRPEMQHREEKTCWRIRWNDRTIGRATTDVKRQPLGHGTVDSLIVFDHLPAGQMARQLFQGGGRLMRMVPAPKRDLEVSFTASSHMEFDPFGALQRFHSSIRVAALGELVRLHGTATDGELHLVVQPGSADAGDSIGGPDAILFERSFPLPADALIMDGLTPQSRLSGLRVGQTWTFRVYRAFPPHDPFRLMQATVEGEEMMAWEQDIEPVMRVVFTGAEGSGVTSASPAASRLWVRDDGTVLRQQMQLGDVDLEFIREPSNACQESAR